MRTKDNKLEHTFFSCNSLVARTRFKAGAVTTASDAVVAVQAGSPQTGARRLPSPLLANSPPRRRSSRG